MENLQTWLTFLVPLAVMILLIWRKADPIIFLFLAALTAGLVAGMPLGTVADTIVTSFGTMLQTAGLVLVFGTVYAHFLSASGGVESLSNALVRKVGNDGSVVAVFILGYVLCIPVNVIPAAAMVSPLIRNLSERTGVARPAYACAFAVPAYLTTCAIVPTLTATVLVTMSGVDMGWFLIYAFGVTIPIAVVSCLLYALFLAKKYGQVYSKKEFEERGTKAAEDQMHLPPVSKVVFLIIIPMALIILNAMIPYLLPGTTAVISLFALIGNPSIALAIGVLLEIIVLKDYLKKPVMKIFADGISGCGNVLVVVGVSGGLGTILTDSGFGNMLMGYVSTWTIPLLVLTWLLASLFHAGIGIYLVACTTLYPILAPAIEAAGISPILFVLMLAVAGVGFLLPTDSAFWIFKEGMGLTTKEAFISITIPGILCSLWGLILIQILNQFSGVLPGLF